MSVSNDLIVLKLYLDELIPDHKINTVRDRKAIQKAVYLAQLLTTNLGYSYSWYLKGPYSPSLTRDYYRLSELMHSEEDEFENWRLDKPLSDRLKEISKKLEEGRTNTGLQKPEWLELLASWCFLIREAKESEKEAEQTLQSRKPSLARFTKNAKSTLSNLGLA